MRVYPDPEALSRAAAEEVASLAQAAVAYRGCFALALAGGETPRALYRTLASEYRERIPWPRVHLFWGDERCVPPDQPANNFAMAYKALISRVAVPSANVHRVPAEVEPPARAAEAYEKALRTFFSAVACKEASPYLFDLILLGMGADGHTASLFPNAPALEERERWVVAVQAPPTVSPTCRITLTLPAINRARYAFFLVAGGEKRTAVHAIRGDPGSAGQRYPAAMVKPIERAIWFTDCAAADAE